MNDKLLNGWPDGKRPSEAAEEARVAKEKTAAADKQARRVAPRDPLPDKVPTQEEADLARRTAQDIERSGMADLEHGDFDRLVPRDHRDPMPHPAPVLPVEPVPTGFSPANDPALRPSAVNPPAEVVAAFLRLIQALANQENAPHGQEVIKVKQEVEKLHERYVALK